MKKQLAEGFLMKTEDSAECHQTALSWGRMGMRLPYRGNGYERLVYMFRAF